MEPEPAKPQFAIILWAALLLFIGLVTFSVGLKYLREWAALQTGLAACSLTWVVTGTAMVVSSVWLVGALGRRLLPLKIGALATIITGAVLVSAVVTHIYPCAYT